MPTSCHIGLLGHRNDAQLQRLAEELTRRGATCFPFDLTDVPRYVRLHWEHGALRFGDTDLLQLDAVYARTAHFPMPTFVPGGSRQQNEALTFPVRESGSLMNSVVAELARHMPVVNPPECHRFHPRKPFLYATLQAAGVPVPEFAVGCDLEAAAYFVHRLGERVVAKPLMGGAVELADLAFLKREHEVFERRPVLLQRRIVGRSSRAYVVDGRVVAAARMEHAPEVVDWRGNLDAITPCTLSAAAEQATRRAVAAVGLIFGAVDLEEEPDPSGLDGWRCWVIDVNPAPMFAGFERRAGLDVAGPLADKLVSLAEAPAASVGPRGDASGEERP